MICHIEQGWHRLENVSNDRVWPEYKPAWNRHFSVERGNGSAFKKTHLGSGKFLFSPFLCSISHHACLEAAENPRIVRKGERQPWGWGHTFRGAWTASPSAAEERFASIMPLPRCPVNGNLGSAQSPLSARRFVCVSGWPQIHTKSLD